jgi:hypothetical protein
MNINKQLLINDEENHIVLKRKTCKDKSITCLHHFTIFIILLLNIVNLIYLIRINDMLDIVAPYAPRIQELVDMACIYVNCSSI